MSPLSPDAAMMSRVWAMPNKWTFKIPPIRALLEKYAGNGSGWADPFAGKSEFAEFRNDLNPENAQPSCVEAGAFLAGVGPIRGVIFDPPYSLTQVSRSYQDIGLKLTDNPTGGFPKVRDRIASLLDDGAYCISFGWNSVGMGIGRGFELVEILLVCHGGNRNDTIVTVERKSP